MGKSKEMSAFLLPYDKEMLLDRLTDEQAGKLFRHLYAYAKREDTPNDERDNSILIVFDCFRTYIDKNKESHQEISTKRQEAAKKRWNKEEDANGCKCMQMDANDANAHFAMQRDANDAISISKSKSILSERETPPTPSEGDGSPSPVEKFLGYLEKEGFDNLLKLVPPTDEQVLWFKANYETKYVTEACRRLDNWPQLPKKKRKMFDTIKGELEVMNSEGLIYHGENR